jgi:hypothetical protein
MDDDQDGPVLVTTGARGGWKLPALVVVVLLVGLVAISRLGGSSGPPVATPTEVALGPSHGPTAPTPTQQPIRSQPAGDHPTGFMPLSADGLSYADGIPTSIGGAPVFRVGDVLLLPLGRQLLVGGWYRAKHCQPVPGLLTCPAATLSDVPLDIAQRDLTTYFVALNEPLVGSGAHIVLAKIESDPRCSIHGGSSCQPRLRVLDQVWSDAG